MDPQAFGKFVDEQLARLRESYERGSDMASEALLLCRKGEGGEAFTEADPLCQVIAMPGLGDREAMFEVRQLAWDMDAFAAAVKHEVWCVELPPDADQETRRRVKAAHAAGKLDEIEPPLRKEKVRVYLECDEVPVRAFSAEILRGEGGRASGLGKWNEAAVELPRPNFRRYLPETRGDKKALVLPVGDRNVVLLSDRAGAQ